MLEFKDSVWFFPLSLINIFDFHILSTFQTQIWRFLKVYNNFIFNCFSWYCTPKFHPAFISAVITINKYKLSYKFISQSSFQFQVARRLRLKDLPGCEGLSGGRSLEKVAESGNPEAFPIHYVMPAIPDCNFSFSGLKAWALHAIKTEEEKQGLFICSVLWLFTTVLINNH